MAGLSCCSLPSTETMKSRHRVPSWTLESNSIREDKKLIGKYHFKNQYNIFHEINKTRRGHIWHKNYKRFPLIDDACRLGLLAQSVVNVRRTGGFFFFTGTVSFSKRSSTNRSSGKTHENRHHYHCHLSLYMIKGVNLIILFFWRIYLIFSPVVKLSVGH